MTNKEYDYKALWEQVKWERDVAVEQLEQLGYSLGEKIRTSEDCVSREEVLKLLEKEDWADTVYGIMALPSVTPNHTAGDCISRQAVLDLATTIETDDYSGNEVLEVVEVEAIKNLPSVTPQTRWIPVSERLPKKEGFYLVSIEVMENPPKITTFTGISQYIVHDEFLGEVNDFNRENVIAWMPLPESYKEGEKDV